MAQRARAPLWTVALGSVTVGRMSTEALVRSFYDDLWNRWDDSLVDTVLSPSFEFRGSLGTSTTGRDGWQSYRDTVRAGSADFHNEVVALVVDGASAAARLQYSGTHTGPLLGISATGRPFEYAGAAFFTVTSGLLASAWVLGDLAGLRAQLEP
jgi:predicted ester cyclase